MQYHIFQSIRIIYKNNIHFIKKLIFKEEFLLLLDYVLLLCI